MNKEELKNILSQKFDFDKWKEILDKIFLKVDFFTSTAKIADSHVKDGGHIGNIRLDDGHSLAIFCFEVTDNVVISRNRKTLREIAAKYVDQSLIHGALVFYYSPKQDDYRLSFIAKQTFFNEDGEPVKKETAPKRYTFLLGKNEPCTTAASRIMELIDKKESGSIGLKEITNAFSVERLNKEFFNGYKAQYTKFLKTIADTKQHRDYVKKLLGRLVFLQFLQKKGWMGVPATNDKWEGGDKNYLRNLMDKYKGNNRILSDVLEPLFFKTLNEKRPGDIADSRLGDNIKIPYLNGGLFDKDRIDELDIDFEYSYFDELINFFSQYNFTIDENDPDDTEVGIDPEMLGHIFENLLEDNKDKGAFYTPKEIVQYMCNESVVQYLKTHTDAQLHAALENLIRNRQVDAELQNKETANAIYELLRAVKVCDPAIGSGAFPMGVLNVLFNTRQILYGFRRDMKPFLPEEVKRDIIQNNIFGVDIEQGAVDIARLRFWLSLVVDSEEPNPLPNLDYKIVCGNSLLSRYRLDEPIKNVFVEYNKKNKENKMSFAKYQQMVKDYLETSDHTKKDEFRKTIEEIKKVFKTHITDKEQKGITDLEYEINCINAPKLLPDYQQTKEEKDKLKDLEKKLKKLNAQKQDRLDNKLYENAFEWRFEFPQLLNDEGDFTGFDIVIGNPPYVRRTNLDLKYKEIYEYKYFSACKQYDLYILFIERGLSIISNKGFLCYINPLRFFNSDSGLKIRQLIAQQYGIKKIVDVSQIDVFKNAMTYPCILQLLGKELVSEVFDFIRVDSKEKIIDIESINKLVVSLLLIRNDEKYRFLIGNEEMSNIINKIEMRSQPLSTKFDVARGLPNKKVNFDSQKYPALKSINVKKYRIEGSLLKIDTAYIDEFVDKMIVMPCTVLYLQAMIKEKEIICLDRIYYLKPLQCMQNMNGFLGVINSSIINYWFEYNYWTTKVSGGYFDLNGNQILSILYPLDKSLLDSISLLVDKILYCTNEKDILIKEIDKLLYQYYELTYDEILVVDPETEISREEYEKVM